MREVGVDLHEHVVAPVDADREAGAVRVAEPDLLGPAQHLDAARARAPTSSARSAVPSGLLSSTTRMSASGTAAADALQELDDVLGFLVGRSDDQRPHEAANLSVARRTFSRHLRYSWYRSRYVPTWQKSRRQHLLGLVGADLAGVVRLGPVVPDLRQDHDVGRRELLVEARSRRRSPCPGPSRCSTCRARGRGSM